MSHLKIDQLNEKDLADATQQAEMATILTATGRAVPAGSERLHILLSDASQHL